MQKFLFPQPLWIQNRSFHARHWKAGLFSLGLVASLLLGLRPHPVSAESPQTAPSQLRQALTQLDAAANSRSVSGVMQFYGSNFSHSDGLSRQTLESALTKLWEQYPNLQYRTELKSWRSEGNGLVAETVTYVTGSQKVGDQEFKLTSTIQSRQRFESQKITRQEVLAERSQITTGENPPTVNLRVPEQVAPGQEFSIDAVVQEPLGDDLLLGAALEEPIKPDALLNPSRINLRPLSAGGIFKVGRAPKQGDNRWISAVLVRHDGITVVTQRLRVVSRVATPR